MCSTLVPTAVVSRTVLHQFHSTWRLKYFSIAESRPGPGSFGISTEQRYGARYLRKKKKKCFRACRASIYFYVVVQGALVVGF